LQENANQYFTKSDGDIQSKYYQTRSNEIADLEMNTFSICKGLLARLNSRNKSPKKTFPHDELVPYSAKRICSDKNKCVIKAPTKYIIKIPVAYNIVPLFDGNNDSVSLELETGGKNSKQLTCQLKKGDAFIVCFKNHVNNSKKCRHNSVNCALHCSRHTLIANSSLQVQEFQTLVILYILPGNEELQPPQGKQEECGEKTDSRLVSYNGKLFKLVNNV
jgi:hypothetical protein